MENVRTIRAANTRKNEMFLFWEGDVFSEVFSWTVRISRLHIFYGYLSPAPPSKEGTPRRMLRVVLKGCTLNPSNFVRLLPQLEELFTTQHREKNARLLFKYSQAGSINPMNKHMA